MLLSIACKGRVGCQVCSKQAVDLIEREGCILKDLDKLTGVRYFLDYGLGDVEVGVGILCFVI